MWTLLALMAAPAAPLDGLPPEAWLMRPSTEVIQGYFPQSARGAGVEGEARIRCYVGPAGEMTACAIARETPDGFGFGETALSATRHYRLRPGALPVGAPVTLSVQYRLRGRGPYIRAEAHDGWAVLQDPHEWQTFFPDRALSEKVSGEAVVRCRPKRGASVICEILSESPGGYGFGQAALKVQAKLRLSPPPAGLPPGPRSITTTIRFNADPPPLP